MPKILSDKYRLPAGRVAVLRSPMQLNPILAVSLVACGIVSTAPAHSTPSRTEANVPVEITLTAQKPHDDPFNTVLVDVRFTDPKGAQKLVPAFWDGGAIWKVRYASPLTGEHRWQTQCSDVSDPGLNGMAGAVKVSSYRGSNPLFKHGPIQTAPDQRHLQHADGTPFFWLGDTWWMGLCHRLHFPDEFKQLAADRKEKGFNVIQIVAGLYPDMHPFDPRGANETGFPWETNYARIRPQYFDAADARLRYLVEQGFAPCIVGAWGYFLPWMGEARAKQHWRELIARYGSWPVVWCVAGEANLPWYLAKGFPYDDREQVKGWTEVTRYARATDPFHRLTTIHPTGMGPLNARHAVTDDSLLDFDMLQTPHGRREAVAPTIRALTNSFNARPVMPLLNGEASYEMLLDSIPARWPRAMFWLGMMNGAAGHTYGANGIWQCNRPGEPHGPSPTAGSPATGYGAIPWNEAMHLPGSRQVGTAKQFLERFLWQRCVPMPGSVTWTGTRINQWGDWIWFPEGSPRDDAPVATRFFRRVFELDEHSKPQGATLRFSADDQATVWLNGKKVGGSKNFRAWEEFDVTRLLRSGRNVIAVQADNLSSLAKSNPAGLMLILEAQLIDRMQTITSDAQWRTSQMAPNGWQDSNFDDSTWMKAIIAASYGAKPWGKFGDDDAPAAPYALGIGDELRIVYAIAPQPLLVRGLRPDASYRLTQFNPVTGQRDEPVRIHIDAHGQWECSAPTHHHDWVIALELDDPQPAATIGKHHTESSGHLGIVNSRRQATDK